MIEKIIISALFSYGWCALFWDDMILNRPGNWLADRLPIYIIKPLFDCQICNAFWVATLMYWLFWGNIWTDWLTVSIGAAGVNAIIVNLINKVEDISKAIKPPTKPPDS